MRIPLIAVGLAWVSLAAGWLLPDVRPVEVSRVVPGPPAEVFEQAATMNRWVGWSWGGLKRVQPGPAEVGTRFMLERAPTGGTLELEVTRLEPPSGIGYVLRRPGGGPGEEGVITIAPYEARSRVTWRHGVRLSGSPLSRWLVHLGSDRVGEDLDRLLERLIQRMRDRLTWP